MKKRVWIPLAVFAVLVAFLAVGLTRDPREVPSPLVGKPAPMFDTLRLHTASGERFSPRDMRGQVWLLNVWASWCVSCRAEHPVLMALAKSGRVKLVGLDYKDAPEKGRDWLQRFGNPYMLSATDPDGRIGIDYGVYGVPETFVIDRNGVIRHKVIGPVTDEVLVQKVLPLVKELEQS
ncbi:MAG TPA: DsbE family thiol:disulfide interchange protein [Ramlibacter sp.]|uniref:DsbE family thiol:disulfide interchange protein n=1 Tax=Ramlibacter sp. TaxID=1917967 RepID=UPI002C3D9918|nr:DsbE family thiol:disulfide interchange protein [Ramlibacter sp.]HVZ43690.1 DsbE family thiol:disulfide interchange protein [Ramlibacter sp.]